MEKELNKSSTAEVEQGSTVKGKQHANLKKTHTSEINLDPCLLLS